MNKIHECDLTDLLQKVESGLSNYILHSNSSHLITFLHVHIYQLILMEELQHLLDQLTSEFNMKMCVYIFFYLLGIEKDHTILGLLSKISFHFHAQMGPFPALIRKN